MSATLYWRPVVVSEGQSLNDQLRFILKLEGRQLPTRFDHTWLDYLRGLADAGITDAQTIIDAIEKHELIELWLEY